MKRNHFLQLIIFCFFAFYSAVAAAVPVDKVVAGKWAEEKGALLLKTFEEENVAEKYRKLDELFIKHVDLDYIGQFVAGKYWKRMSPVQQDKYQKLFKRYALGVYKGFPLSFKNKIAFKVNNVVSDSNFTDVWTSIDIGAAEPGSAPTLINVAFRLHQKGGQPQIVDITLAESSLILSYRARFYKMIMDSDEDLEWFLEDLETSAVSTEKNNLFRLQQAQYSQPQK